jgi:ferredoxin
MLYIAIISLLLSAVSAYKTPFKALRPFALQASNFQVTINDNGKKTKIEVSPEETLLEAMMKHKEIDPPSGCKAGTGCGVCTARVSNPAFIEHEVEYVITDHEREQGFIFSCVAYVKANDITVDINQEEPYTNARKAVDCNARRG